MRTFYFVPDDRKLTRHEWRALDRAMRVAQRDVQRVVFAAMADMVIFGSPPSCHHSYFHGRSALVSDNKL
jgi:hypothetical protein